MHLWPCNKYCSLNFRGAASVVFNTDNNITVVIKLLKTLLILFQPITLCANSIKMTLEDVRKEEFVISAKRHSYLVFICCITDKTICIHCTYSLLSAVFALTIMVLLA